MSGSKTPEGIIKWYETWTPAQGVEDLIEARQHLSIAATRVAKQIGEMEKEHAKLYAERKIEKAIKFLEYEDGTGAEREQKATRDTKDISLKEAEAHGRLRGAKIYFDSLCKVLDSMASWISRERS